MLLWHKDGYGRFFFKLFANLVVQAWEAREAALRRIGEPLIEPRMVSSIRHRMSQVAQNTQISDIRNAVKSMDIDNVQMSMPMDTGSDDFLYNMGGYGVNGLEVYPDMPGQAPLDADLNG